MRLISEHPPNWGDGSEIGNAAANFAKLPNRESFANFAEFERLYGAERQCLKAPYAPYMGYFRGRDELKGLLRSLVSNVVDIRDPIQIACDRIAERAGTLPV
jgi:hypothetical protein